MITRRGFLGKMLIAAAVVVAAPLVKLATSEPVGVVVHRFTRRLYGNDDFMVAFGDSLFKKLQEHYLEDPKVDWRQIVSTYPASPRVTRSAFKKAWDVDQGAA